MASAFDDFPVPDYKNQVRMHHRGKPVSNHHDRFIPADLLNGFLYQLFAFVIERACGLIQKDQRRIFQKYARKRNPLFLPARELDSPFPDFRVIAVRQQGDKAVRKRFLGSGDHFFIRSVMLSYFDVIDELYKKLSCVTTPICARRLDKE